MEKPKLKIHILKTDSSYFQDIINGKKTFEVRFNDRDFKVGDILELEEYLFRTDIKGETVGVYMDDYIKVEVVYILRNFIGLKDGYVVLGIKLCK